MELREVNMNSWGRRYEPIDSLFEKFIESENSIMEVVGWEDRYASSYSCGATLTNAAKNRKLGIRCAIHDGKVYLIKEELK